MDFKRIEKIFLLVFIAINIFLFITILQKPILTTNSGNSSANLARDMVVDNISLPKLSSGITDSSYVAAKELDTLSNEVGSLRNQRVSYDKTTRILTSQLNTPINVTKSMKELNDFIQNNGILFGNEYVYSKELSSPSEIVYIQETPFGYIYDVSGQVKFEINDNMISGYTQQHIGKLQQLRNKQATISEEKAVEQLYTYSEIAANSKVKWIKLGYSVLTEVKGSQVLTPTYFVAVSGKSNDSIQVKKVNAFTGSIIAMSVSGAGTAN